MLERPTMLTIKETAKELNLPEHYIRQLCKSGKIVSVKAGVKNLINLQKTIDYFNNPTGSANTDPPDDSGKIRRVS